MRSIHPVTMLFQRRPRCLERFRGPAQVARDKRDLGFGHDAPRPRHRLPRAEGTRGTPQKSLCSNEITELRHRDAPQRERRSVVAERHPVQRAEWIARGQRTPCGSNQRVHSNPATLVTPTTRCSTPICSTSIQQMEQGTMTKHLTGTRSEWLAARLELLEAEKELTRRSDDMVRRRQELPWVRIDKPYRFETEQGSASLADLFQGRSQLLVYHFMFGPDYKAGCPSCSAIADGFNGSAVHLANHDATLLAVSRAPFAKLQAYRQRMGWTFPWASSLDSDFNADFNVWFSEEQQRQGGIEYNYRHEAAFPLPGRDAASQQGPAAKMAAMSGTDVATYTRERPGMSAFVRDDRRIYHTYS